MKKNQTVWGSALAAMALILCLALASCPTDENDLAGLDTTGGGGNNRAAPSLPGAAGSVKTLQNYTTPNAPGYDASDPIETSVSVASVSDAVTLFSSVTTLLTTGTKTLKTPDTTLYNNGFEAAQYLHGNLNEILEATTLSFPVSINDQNQITTIMEPVSSGGPKHGSITGSSTSTYSSNKELVDFDGDFSASKLKEKGDTYTVEYKGNRTFEITTGFVQATSTATTKVAGYIRVVYSSIEKQTLAHVLDKIYNKSSSEQISFAVTLVATDGSKGAKFVLRGASAGSSASTWLGTASSSSDKIFSNLEVYNNAGEPIAGDFDDPVNPATIPVDTQTNLGTAADAWLTFAESVVKQDLSNKLKL